MSLIRADARHLPLVDGCLDSCVTDPPYGIGFMGKEWDTFKPGVEQRRIVPNRAIDSENTNLKGRTRGPASSPSAVEYDRTLSGQQSFQAWTETWAREVLRVLKPGAHILVCGAPRSFHRMTCGLEDAGFEIRDCLSWLYGQGFPKSLNLGDGQGTALKPAWEPIILARKPVEGTVAANRTQHGTGTLNIDMCRIDGLKPDVKAIPRATDPHIFKTASGTHSGEMTNIGRWPANVVLDEDAATMLNEQSGELTSVFMAAGTKREGIGWHGGLGCEVAHDTKGDIGGASRFYYVAKPSREERDFGTVRLTARQRDESRKDGNPGGDNPRNRGLQPRGNFHPTVKPVELMRWLVRLATPLNGLVLDPFVGSGTTGMACRYEQRRFIGLDLQAEYLRIAASRVGAVAPLFAAVNA